MKFCIQHHEFLNGIGLESTIPSSLTENPTTVKPVSVMGQDLKPSHTQMLKTAL
jgi:hypothetical protein